MENQGSGKGTCIWEAGSVWTEPAPSTYLMPFPHLPGQKEQQRQSSQRDHGEGQRPPEHEPQETQPSYQVPLQQIQLLAQRLAQGGRVLCHPRCDGTCGKKGEESGESEAGPRWWEELTGCQQGGLRRLGQAPGEVGHLSAGRRGAHGSDPGQRPSFELSGVHMSFCFSDFRFPRYTHGQSFCLT